MKKTIIFALLLIASTSLAGPKYRESSDSIFPPGTEVKTVFDNISTVGTGDTVRTGFLPTKGTYELVPFNNLSTFEFTIDASIRCIAGSFYPVSTMTGDTSVRLRGFDFSGYNCIQPNLRSKVGVGGVSVYFIERGE